MPDIEYGSLPDMRVSNVVVLLVLFISHALSSPASTASSCSSAVCRTRVFSACPFPSSPQLADFGLATVLYPPAYKVVEPVGSPGYAAPELLRVIPYDGKADVFSLGVISFVLLSGACSKSSKACERFSSSQHTLTCDFRLHFETGHGTPDRQRLASRARETN